MACQPGPDRELGQLRRNFPFGVDAQPKLG
jgi:hypothetical protein